MRIALVAGEASGDLLGAALIERIKALVPDAEFAGVAGGQMIEAGCKAWHSCDELAVMGLVEVLKHLPRLLRLRREIRGQVLAFQPDVFIGIDAPDFNLGLEQQLKSRGIKTVHYVSPSIWAWRESRAGKIAKSADRVLCLFPMEPPIYAKYGVAAPFVGHPLASRMLTPMNQTEARSRLDLPAEGRVLALLPGSRAGEIQRLGDIFISAALQIENAMPGLRVVAPMANTRCYEQFSRMVANRGARAVIHVVEGRSHEALYAADATLLASGTAALEAMLTRTPMVVAYRINALTHWLVKTLGMLKTSWYSLPNILAGYPLVQECMQDQCTPEALTDAVLALLRDGQKADAMRTDFEALHRSLLADRSAAAKAVIALATHES
ncbi:lipid-A-disaccharide synthase [Ahniella affigens]|uniref:Lipid-A-disaccharide synthase n=1 Tax=Ahniella affigens TaxID=2021234 RepID=A0A2P1PMK3_9GAMM|nr:lipid-A-disaccharide synthase [Ahniella affigens]AVP96057.1 lipid-A-disaccharide synthase [Ahniella affigens]